MMGNLRFPLITAFFFFLFLLVFNFFSNPTSQNQDLITKDILPSQINNAPTSNQPIIPPKYLTCFFQFGPSNQLMQLRECFSLSISLSRILILPNFIKSHYQDTNSPEFLPLNTLIDVDLLTDSKKTITVATAEKLRPALTAAKIIFFGRQGLNTKSAARYDGYNRKMHSNSILAPSSNTPSSKSQKVTLLKHILNSPEHKSDAVISVYSFLELQPSREALVAFRSPSAVVQASAVAIDDSKKPYACVHIRREKSNIGQCKNFPYPRREIECPTYHQAVPTFDLMRLIQNVAIEKKLKTVYVAAAYPEKFEPFAGEVDFILRALPNTAMHLTLPQLPANSTGSDLSILEQEICSNADVFIRSKVSTWSAGVVQKRMSLGNGNGNDISNSKDNNKIIIDASDTSWMKKGYRSTSKGGCPKEKEIDKDRLTIVGAMSKNHFYEMRMMVASAFRNARRKDGSGRGSKIRIILYDLGDLSDQMRAEIARYCPGGQVELRKFDWSKMPENRGLKGCSWKALIVQEVLTETPVFLYVDASVRFKMKINKDWWRKVAGRGDVHGTGIGVRKTLGTVTEYTHKLTIQEMGLGGLHEFLSDKTMMAAGLLSIDCTVNNEVVNLVDEWVDGCTRASVFMPVGSDQCLSVVDEDGYRCHRYDQSILNVLLYARFGLSGANFNKSDMWNRATSTKINQRMRQQPKLQCDGPESAPVQTQVAPSIAAATPSIAAATPSIAAATPSIAAATPNNAVGVITNKTNT